MDKKNKGLADNHEGDFILNESGTSVKNPATSEDKNSERNGTSAENATNATGNEGTQSNVSQ